MAGKGDAWIFAYGSLMWRPGFEFLERRTALLRGYHRALCVYSFKYRGTPEAPGLVLGLDRGGACKGLAYRVASDSRAEVLAYLDAREHSYDVYHARWLSVRLDDGRRVPAYSFVANHEGAQYAGRQPRDRVLHLLRTGKGEQGTALDYLENTVRHLDELGIPDGPLHRLLEEATSSPPSTAP